jgi:asparagine N-glycosylation enzyme membrane subunit Stt3
MFGSYRGDVYGMVFWLAAFWLLFLGMRKNNKKGLLLSGLLISLSSFFWIGGFFGVAVFFGFLFIALLRDFCRGKKFNFYWPILVPIAVMPFLIRPLTMAPNPYEWVLPVPLSLVLSVSLLILAKVLNQISGIGKNKRAAISVILLLAVLAVLALMNPVAGEQAIGELQKPQLNLLWLGYIWEKFNLAVLFGIAGFVLLCLKIRKLSGKDVSDAANLENETKNNNHILYSLFIIVFTLMGLFAFLNGIRFAFILSIPLSILSAVALSRLLERNCTAYSGQNTDNTISSKGASSGKKYLVVTAVILLTFLAIGAQFSTVSFTRPDQHWAGAMDWLKANSEKNSTVMVWWSYGGYVQGMAERASWVDGVSGQDWTRIEKIAKTYLTGIGNKAALDYLKNADYLVFTMEDAIIEGRWLAILNRAGFSFDGKAFLVLERDGNVYKRGGMELTVNVVNNTVLAFANDNGRMYFVRDAAVETISGGKKTRTNTKLSVDQIDTNFGPIPVRNVSALIMPDAAIYMTNPLTGKIFTEFAVMGRPADGFELAYSSGHVKVYKVEK